MNARVSLRRAAYALTAFFFLLLLAFPQAYGRQERAGYESQRAKMLGYLLRYDLSSLHYTREKMDDDISRRAYKLYLKQLDPQKRFFLKEDEKRLSAYSRSIDDEINSGDYELPALATDILAKRASWARGVAKDLLSKDFDFSSHEYVETDPEKLDYCDTTLCLKERWRKMVELQVLHQLLNLEDDEKPQAPRGGTGNRTPPDLQKKAREKVLRSYETFFSELQRRNDREKYDRFFNSIASAYDPHTEYMPPASKEDFDISMRGTLEGIGATLREEDGYIKVVEVIPGSPAARQGQLQAEDVILKVAEKDKEPVDITYMGVRDAVKLIRGKKGTEVRLTVKKPGGSRVVIPIVRDIIKLEDHYVKGTLLKSGTGGPAVGYIKIPSFYRDFDHSGGSGRNCTDDVKKELSKLERAGMAALILDLRNDGGGALTDAIRTAGLFIKTGPVVQVKASDGQISVLSDEDPGVQYAGPMVVLVNKFSASASEILSGALQDYRRAVIIGGEHTHGKGTVQTIIDLNEFLRSHKTGINDQLGALKITTQKFYRISGESTQYRGVTPDIVLPDQFQGLKTGEQYLDFALPWDTIRPAQYQKWPSGPFDISALRARSEKRVSADAELADIAKENREFIERQKKTLQPLNADEAKKQQEELKTLMSKKETKNLGGHGGKTQKADTSHLSEAERDRLWNKEVGEDPYVREAVSVLHDMLSFAHTSAFN